MLMHGEPPFKKRKKDDNGDADVVVELDCDTTDDGGVVAVAADDDADADVVVALDCDTTDDDVVVAGAASVC